MESGETLQIYYHTDMNIGLFDRPFVGIIRIRLYGYDLSRLLAPRGAKLYVAVVFVQKNIGNVRSVLFTGDS